MLVHEVMTAPVVTVPRDWTVRQAIRLLYEADITAAPVVDEEDRMVGIVSEMDLLRGQFEADPRAYLRLAAPPESSPPTGVEEVMTPNVRTARETDDVLGLVEVMITTGVKSVPVVRDAALVGIVSRRDLMGILAHGDERIRDDVRAALRELSAETAATRVTVHEGVVELRGDGDERTARIADVIAQTVPGVVRVVHRP
ncbi:MULTISPECIES: CBS domain-containing protein [Actinoallomurus]|uniref:CBS domain-containing protein n=1 Tax=Actinoallomurus TaxID=667113 RepID=UPI00209398A6|nr:MULTISPECIES: CBS domain-containing protein [Actinoallomurus]MCO5967837.1 CBS domain-containing protein [Actinoallomurus soli]MCO5995584.1 CBS domain-containing protein [Actinoallomurus rhizosphaericola]